MKVYPSNIELGDIFDSDCNILVVPRNSNGGISTNSLQGVTDLGISADQYNAHTVPGEIQYLPLSNNPNSQNASVQGLVFATTVDEGLPQGATRSSLLVVRNIVKAVIDTIKDDEKVEDVAFPLLGAAAGGLEYVEVYRAIRGALAEFAPANIKFHIYTLNDWAYQTLLLDGDFVDPPTTLDEFLNDVGDNHLPGQQKTDASTITPRILSDLFAEKDDLDHELYAHAIVKFIQNKNTKPPLTIGIFAPWGKGKTSMMHFIQKKLSANTAADKPPVNSATDIKIKKEDLKKVETTNDQLYRWLSQSSLDLSIPKLEYPTVWFNAWKFQKTEEIWAGFAFEIINQLVNALPERLDREKFWLALNLKRVDEQKIRNDITFGIVNKVLKAILKVWILVLLLVAGVIFLWLSSGSWAGIAITCMSGISLTGWAIYSYKKARSAKVDVDVSKYVRQPDYHSKMGYFHSVESDLKAVFKLLVDDERPAVIFIDDLDRCSPKMVAEVVEAINLFISGDFPNCYFILGQDAQMVAASLDVAYKDVGDRVANLEKGYGSLGWYFMEKFIQLQFSIPNITKDQSKKYLTCLFEESNASVIGQGDRTKPELDEAAATKAIESLMRDVNQSKDNNELIKVTASIADRLAPFPEVMVRNKVKAVIEKAIDKAAENFNDNDPDAITVINDYVAYLDTSPRMIKRFVNLYRFYRFIQFSASKQDLAKVEASAIGKWIVIMIRWPQLVRCIQWDSEVNFFSASTPVERAVSFDKCTDRCQSFADWKILLMGQGMESIQWMLDQVLFDFIKKTKKPGNELSYAVEAGFW